MVRACGQVLRGGDGGDHGLLLYKLVQCYTNTSRPVIVLDVGTARGFSAMTMSRAMEDAAIPGHVHTVDIIDHHESLHWHAVKHEADDPLAGAAVTRAEIWAKWFQEGGGITPITGRSADVLREWDQGPIDLAFLDGSHAYADVKRELTQLESLMDEKGTIVVDDYHLGSTVVRIPSRLITAFAQRLRRVCEIAWPRMSKHVARFGAGNEYALVTYRLHGTRKAVAEFLADRPRAVVARDCCHAVPWRLPGQRLLAGGADQTAGIVGTGGRAYASPRRIGSAARLRRLRRGQLASQDGRRRSSRSFFATARSLSGMQPVRWFPFSRSILREVAQRGRDRPLYRNAAER